MDRPDGSGGRVAIWHGWATAGEVGQTTIELLAHDPDHEAKGAGELQVRTLFDVMDVWLPQRLARPDLAGRTKLVSRGCAERIAESRLARVTVDRVRRRVLQQLRDDLLARHSPATVRLDLRHLRQAWTDLRDQGLVPDRELPKVRVVGGPVRDRHTPSRADVLAVLEHAAAHAPVRDWRALYLLWATGCRLGEIDSLAWERIDMDAGVMEVVGKQGRRSVRLHPAVVRELRSWESGTGRLWDIRRLDAAVRLAIDRACEALQIRRFMVSGLRRHAVDALYGVTTPDVAASQMGHSPAVALRHYRRVRGEQWQEAVVRSGLGLLPSDDNVIDLPQKPAPAAEK